MTVQATNYDGSKSYNLLQDTDIKINSSNKTKIACGTITLNVKGTAYATLFTASQLQSLLGISSGSYSYKRVSAVVTNGDSSLLGDKIESTYMSSVDGSLSITFSASAAGNFAINYAIIYDMD